MNSLIESVSGKSISATKAHTSDITDITIVRRDEMLTLVGSCSRDRTIQIFKKLCDGLSLLQTLDDHAGAISQLTFSNDGTTLLSSSSDRTVMVRTLVFGAEKYMAYVTTRIITLKASPVAFATMPDNADTLIISSMDRQIQMYEISSGRHINSIKASDSEQNDAVILNAVTAQRLPNIPFPSAVVVGVASADKSIRIYDYDNGSMLIKEHGHTEGISDIATMQSRESNPQRITLISTGLDGIIMIWELHSRIQRQSDAESPVEAPVSQAVLKLTTASDTPKRRVLTRSELSELQRNSETTGDSTPQTPPPRDGSPSRIRRKTSRHTLSSQPPKLPVPPIPSSNLSPPTFSQPTGLKNPQNRPPTPPIPKTAKPAKPRRTLHRTKSAGKLPDVTTEKLCTTLRAYRKNLTTANKSLPPDSARELERELHLTARALSDKTRRSPTGGGAAVAGATQLFEEDLARMIDEKIAVSVVKQTLARITKSTNAGEEASGSESELDAIGGA